MKIAKKVEVDINIEDIVTSTDREEAAKIILYIDDFFDDWHLTIKVLNKIMSGLDFHNLNLDHKEKDEDVLLLVKNLEKAIKEIKNGRQ